MSNETKYPIHITIGTGKFEVHQETMTPAELKTYAGVDPQTYNLFLAEAEGVNVPVDDQDVVYLDEDMQFFVVHRENPQITITINAQSYTAPTYKMTGAQIKELAQIPDTSDLYLMPTARDTELIADAALLYLVPDEQFVSRVRPELVDIEVNEIQVPIQKGAQTGASIKEAAMKVADTKVSSVDVVYQLPTGDEIGDNQTIEIHGHERFKTLAPEGSSS